MSRFTILGSRTKLVHSCSASRSPNYSKSTPRVVESDHSVSDLLSLVGTRQMDPRSSSSRPPELSTAGKQLLSEGDQQPPRGSLKRDTRTTLMLKRQSTQQFSPLKTHLKESSLKRISRLALLETQTQIKHSKS